MVQTVQGVNIVEELAQQHQVLHAPQPQTVVGTTVNPGNKTVTIIPMVKPSPTKAGNKNLIMLLLDCFGLFFIFLKMELLAQFLVSYDEK